MSWSFDAKKAMSGADTPMPWLMGTIVYFPYTRQAKMNIIMFACAHRHGDSIAAISILASMPSPYCDRKPRDRRDDYGVFGFHFY